MKTKFIRNIDISFIFLLVFYFLSRLYFHLVLRLDFTYYYNQTIVQYLDVSWLKSNFWESLFYLHSQPPLFNFLFGSFEILFGNSSSDFFLLLFHLLGFLTAFLAYQTLVLLKVNKIISVIIITIYLITPATILYEKLFFYTHFVIFLLVFSAYNFIRFYIDEKIKNAFLFFLGICFAILTTSLFHLLWFIILSFLILYHKRNRFITLLKASAIPFIIISSLYLKNYIVFNEFSTSSWLGLNLSRITVHQLDYKEKAKQIKEGTLSDFSAIGPFTHFKDLDTFFIKKHFLNKQGITVLDEPQKTNKQGNFNNIAYINLSKRLFRDDIYIIINYPKVYLQGIENAFKKYFDSPTNYKLLSVNVLKIYKYNKLFNSFIYGINQTSKIGYITIIVFILILLFSFQQLLSRSVDHLTKALIQFFIINIFYVMLVGNFLEYGENNRFRFYTEVFYYLLAAIILNYFVLKIKKIKKRYEYSRTHPQKKKQRKSY